MTWTHGTSANAQVAGATSITVAKPAGFANGQLLWAVVNSGQTGVTWPPGWIVDGKCTDDGGGNYEWGHRVGANEPTSYTWSAASTNWIVLLESFNSTVALDTNNVVDQYATVKASATSTTLAGARPFEQNSGDLLIYFAGSGGSQSTTWPAGVTNLQNANGVGCAWEVFASTGQTTARTVTYGSTTTNRVETTTAYAALAPPSAVVHTLSGSGQVAIANPVAIDIALTGLAGSLGTGKGNPVRYFELGNIAWGTALGFGRNYYLEHANEIVVAPFATCTLLAYSFAPGITATVTEHLAL